MKKTFAIILAVILTFCSMIPASAAESEKRVVYVASKLIPEAATDFARDYFNKYMPAQDICDVTDLTVSQVKEVRLCPAFTVEPLDADTVIRYYFPIIHKDTYVATLEVSWASDSALDCHIVSGGDPFIKALNTLSSSASSPMMFAITNNAYFALDSKNKAALLKEFIPAPDKEITKQKRAVQEMRRPVKTVPISADKAYPERISSLQADDAVLTLTVLNETNYSSYTSTDNGKRWRFEYPPVYISFATPYHLKDSTKVPYTVHNRTGREISVRMDFTLQKWNGGKWVACPETDSISFSNSTAVVQPHNKRTLKADWGKAGIKLGVGKYKLIKKLYVGKQRYTCEAVFVLE